MRKSYTNMKSWRDLREEIIDKSPIEKITSTVEYWSKVGRVNYYMDWDKPENWVTPWEIINDDYYDDVAISIMMLETLIYTGFDESEIQLFFIINKEDNCRFMVCVVDGKYLLNYSHNEVIDFEENKNKFTIIDSFKRMKTGKYERVTC